MESQVPNPVYLLVLPLFFTLIYEIVSLGIFRSLFGFLGNPLFD